MEEGQDARNSVELGMGRGLGDGKEGCDKVREKKDGNLDG